MPLFSVKFLDQTLQKNNLASPWILNFLCNYTYQVIYGSLIFNNCIYWRSLPLYKSPYFTIVSIYQICVHSKYKSKYILSSLCRIWIWQLYYKILVLKIKISPFPWASFLCLPSFLREKLHKRCKVFILLWSTQCLIPAHRSAKYHIIFILYFYSIRWHNIWETSILDVSFPFSTARSFV